MKIGLMLPNYARWFRDEAIYETCARAKELDVDSLCFMDHIIFTRSQYVGFGNGYQDIWTSMSYIAAVTNIQGWRPILTQAVVDIPYRPAVQQAKIAAATISRRRTMARQSAGCSASRRACHCASRRRLHHPTSYRESQRLAARLREKPEVVRSLGTSFEAETALFRFQLSLLQPGRETFRLAQEVRQVSGLLMNDSLLAAVAREHAIKHLATADRDFERVRDLRVCLPSDLR